MSGGRDLLGQLEATRRKPGRPKGSGNKRARDLKGYVEARFGGSAAIQMAAACMVTPAEVKAAGGSVISARLAKAKDLAKALDCTVKEAWELLSRELAALAPYTDQRQPLAVEAVGDAFRPAVVVMGGAPGPAPVQLEGASVEIAGEFRVIEHQVSRPGSHDQAQGLDLEGEPAAGPSHGE